MNLDRKSTPDWARHFSKEPRWPVNHRAPALYRLLAAQRNERGKESATSRDLPTATVEALLFIADEPLPLRRIVKAAGLRSADEGRAILERLRQIYDEEGSPFQVEEIAGGYQLLTRPEYHRWLAAWRPLEELSLSPAAKETLAIVAWRQPITRAEIESIRGVQCGDILRQLTDLRLIRIAGRHQSLGRPVLYGTTKKFLAVFGLRSLKDLPDLDELAEP